MTDVLMVLIGWRMELKASLSLSLQFNDKVLRTETKSRD